jgi:hypothetical protein
MIAHAGVVPVEELVSLLFAGAGTLAGARLLLIRLVRPAPPGGARSTRAGSSTPARRR